MNAASKNHVIAATAVVCAAVLAGCAAPSTGSDVGVRPAAELREVPLRQLMEADRAPEAVQVTPNRKVPLRQLMEADQAPEAVQVTPNQKVPLRQLMEADQAPEAVHVTPNRKVPLRQLIEQDR